MRIAHVSDCYLPRLGGIERQVHDLAVRQQESGHDVVIVTSVAGVGSPPPDGLPVVRPRLRPGSSPTRMEYEASRRGVRAVREGGFDVVHVHASSFSPLSFLTAAAASKAGLPAAVTVHSLWAAWTPLFAGAHRLIRWGEWNVAWSAVSSPAAEPLRRILDPRTPVTILPNGVDPQEWQGCSSTGPADGSRRVVVATVGRLAVRKRPGPLLRMLREARTRLPEGVGLEAILVGDGPLRRPLERYVESSGMGSWVRMTGPATHAELKDLYAGVDFYIAPATLESFGIAALEARCAGLPVVAYRCSGVSEFIVDGKDGFLCRDDAEMTERIAELVRSAPTRELMREHARSVPPPVCWPGVLRATEALYARARALAGARTDEPGLALLG